MDESGERRRSQEQFKLVEIETAPSIFKEVIQAAAEVRTNFRESGIEGRRMAVVVSAYDAKDVLPQTLKEITGQMKQLGLSGEIFVILNNGGGDTREYLNAAEGSDQIGKQAREIGVNEVVFGRTMPLAAEGANSRSVPRVVNIEGTLPKQADGIKLVLIDQQVDPDNAGKIRGLRDVYEFLRQQNQKTGYRPQYLLAIDAETRLRPVDTRKKEVMTEVNSGLGHMVDLSKEGKVMVGAKLQFVPYRSDGSPNWKEKTPSMQESISIMHGMKGYEWLPGGATLGGFSDMVSILSAITRVLPGSRIEDVMTTAVAKAMSIGTKVDQEVVHANRCPSEDDREAVVDQMTRWIRGKQGLEKIIGRSMAKRVIDDRIIRILTYPLIELAKGRRVDVPLLLKGLLPYLNVIKLTRGAPDDFVGGSAVFRPQDHSSIIRATDL